MTKQSIKWTKCESVTSGGKPFFWTALAGYSRYWVSWSSAASSWELTQMDNGSSQERSLGYFDTAHKAKLAAE